MRRKTSLMRQAQALLLVLAATAAYESPWAAPAFDNGAFVDDFDSWSGLITDSTFTPTLVDPATDPRFQLIGNGFAELSNDSTYFEAILFQDFLLDGTATALAFEYAWMLSATATGPGASPDFVQALLWLIDTNGDFVDYIDLFPAALDTEAATGSGTSITDISPFAGETVSLEFLVQGGDSTMSDWLQIGNIAIAQAPLPPSTALLLLGLAPLLCRRALQAPVGRCPVLA
jgi:hypothetical protein